jgi:hypothetical protein
LHCICWGDEGQVSYQRDFVDCIPVVLLNMFLYPSVSGNVVGSMVLMRFMLRLSGKTS